MVSDQLRKSPHALKLYFLDFCGNSRGGSSSIFRADNPDGAAVAGEGLEQEPTLTTDPNDVHLSLKTPSISLNPRTARKPFDSRRPSAPLLTYAPKEIGGAARSSPLSRRRSEQHFIKLVSEYCDRGSLRQALDAGLFLDGEDK